MIALTADPSRRAFDPTRGDTDPHVRRRVTWAGGGGAPDGGLDVLTKDELAAEMTITAEEYRRRRAAS